MERRSHAQEPGSAGTELRFIDRIVPEQVGHQGTLFASQALALMDRAAFITATRHTHRVLTMTRREMAADYIPVRQGQLVEIVSRLAAIDGASVNVETSLYAEDLFTGDRRLNAQGRFTLVASEPQDMPASVMRPDSPAAKEVS